MEPQAESQGRQARAMSMGATNTGRPFFSFLGGAFRSVFLTSYRCIDL
jgi:hypothetical protein